MPVKCNFMFPPLVKTSPSKKNRGAAVTGVRKAITAVSGQTHQPVSVVTPHPVPVVQTNAEHSQTDKDPVQLSNSNAVSSTQASERAGDGGEKRKTVEEQRGGIKIFILEEIKRESIPARHQ